MTFRSIIDDALSRKPPQRVSDVRGFDCYVMDAALKGALSMKELFGCFEWSRSPNPPEMGLSNLSCWVDSLLRDTGAFLRFLPLHALDGPIALFQFEPAGGLRYIELGGDSNFAEALLNCFHSYFDNCDRAAENRAFRMRHKKLSKLFLTSQGITELQEFLLCVRQSTVREKPELTILIDRFWWSVAFGGLIGLHDEGSHEFLVEGFNLRVTTHLEKQLSDFPHNANYFGIAAPIWRGDPNRSFGPLHYAPIEGEIAFNYWNHQGQAGLILGRSGRTLRCNANIWSDFSGSVIASIKEWLGISTNGNRLLHVASHVAVDLIDPNQTELLLDNSVFARDFEHILSNSHIDVVIISACAAQLEQISSPSEATTGLADALLRAKSQRCVITSLCDVNDALGAVLVSLLWFCSGKPHQRLCQAQRKLIEAERHFKSSCEKKTLQRTESSRWKELFESVTSLGLCDTQRTLLKDGIDSIPNDNFQLFSTLGFQAFG